jgi:antibiotic biosynthesis monooxygenase (ABM) superfamily enzyme
VSAEPVTVIITRRVKAGRTADYEAWLQRLQHDARDLPGYLGVTTQRPAPGAPPEYVSVLRFDSLASLRAFERSELRARALAEVSDFVEGDAAWQTLLNWIYPKHRTV